MKKYYPKDTVILGVNPSACLLCYQKVNVNKSYDYLNILGCLNDFPLCNKTYAK